MKLTVKQIVDFYDRHPECIGELKIETRYGWYKVEYADITAYDSDVICVITSENKMIYTSPDHLLHNGIDWIKTKDLSINDNILTRDGIEKVKSLFLCDEKEDLYDLQVEDVKEFYANDLVSHNSSLLDAITFALYGKPFRKINKPQLLNSINQKELVVEINFNIGVSSYKIIRGMKPVIFEIYKDDVLLNQDAAKKDYQEYLEQNILKMNYKSFTQIVILGSATYVPFMDLPTGQRREIIEDLLDIQVFSVMNNLLKEKITNNKTSITENNYNIDLIKSKIESAIEHNNSIKKIKTEQVNVIKTKILETITKIENEKIIIEEIDEEILDLINTITDKKAIQKKNESIKGIKYDLESKRKTLEKDILFYHDNDNCPICKQGIEHGFKTSAINEKQDKLNEIDNASEQLKIKAEEIENRLKEISDIEDKIQKLNLSASEHKAQIKIFNNSLQTFKKELDNAQKMAEEIDLSKLNEFKKTLKIYEDEQTKLYDEKETFNVASYMLKDGGIKTRIIKQYIPIMNKLINKYLNAFDLFVEFNLDENFNEIIKSRFRDTFSYSSFSEGEKLRITLSIMLSWRAIAKLRNSVSTNLLILDETLDGALDGSGIENLIDTLHNLHNNDNIFVISHRGDMFGEKFNSHIRFEKVKNFSQIAT